MPPKIAFPPQESVEVVLQRNLLHYYKRDGSTYLELENHSDALRDMNKITTPTVIISGCT